MNWISSKLLFLWYSFNNWIRKFLNVTGSKVKGRKKACQIPKNNFLLVSLPICAAVATMAWCCRLLTHPFGINCIQKFQKEKVGELLESNSLMNVEANRVCTKFCIVESFFLSLPQKKLLHMHFLWKLNVLCSQDVNVEPMKDFKRPSIEMELEFECI